MDFPTLVVDIIFSFLGKKDLMSCSLVCRKWRNLSNRRETWVSFIEEQLHSILDNSIASNLFQLSDPRKLKHSRFNSLSKLYSQDEIEVPLLLFFLLSETHLKFEPKIKEGKLSKA